jgi:hypothetical protein
MKAPESEEQPVVFIVDDDESLRDALVGSWKLLDVALQKICVVQVIPELRRAIAEPLYRRACWSTFFALSRTPFI